MRYSRPQACGSRTKVLVVEKEPIVVRVLTMALRESGFEVLTAHTAEKARELFHSHAATLCLVAVDINLDRHGVQFVQSLPDLTPRIPILFITELGNLEVESIGNVNDPVLYKPFGIPEFLEAVASTVGRNATPPWS